MNVWEESVEATASIAMIALIVVMVIRFIQIDTLGAILCGVGACFCQITVAKYHTSRKLDRILRTTTPPQK